MTKLVGNEKARKQLEKLLPLTRVVLLSGPAGVGKFIVAQQVALAVAEPGDCMSHRGALGVDFVRGIIEDSHLKAMGTKGKAFIIECEEFSTEAMNALLKVLEEPPANTFFFLVSSVDLPSTIVSRCQRVGFRSMSRPEVIEALVLSGWSYVAADRVAGAGSVGRAMAEYSYDAARTNVTTFLNACHNVDLELITRAIPEWGTLEVRFLHERMLNMAQVDSDKRSDMLDLAVMLQVPASCAKLTLLCAARVVMARKIV